MPSTGRGRFACNVRVGPVRTTCRAAAAFVVKTATGTAPAASSSAPSERHAARRLFSTHDLARAPGYGVRVRQPRVAEVHRLHDGAGHGAGLGALPSR